MRSARLSAVAATSTRTSPAPGGPTSGTSETVRTSGPPGEEQVTARTSGYASGPGRKPRFLSAGCPRADRAARSGAQEDATLEHFVVCSRGCTHWGAHGAAGLLLRGPLDRFLLVQRGLRTHQGGTWSVPGGAALQG